MTDRACDPTCSPSTYMFCSPSCEIEWLRGTPTFRPMRPRGRETSNALVAVRTVLSRAETALEEIERGEYACDAGGYPLQGESGEWIKYQDEDYDEMRAALEHVVESLVWWRRTGRPRKGD